MNTARVELCVGSHIYYKVNNKKYLVDAPEIREYPIDIDDSPKFIEMNDIVHKLKGKTYLGRFIYIIKWGNDYEDPEWELFMCLVSVINNKFVMLHDNPPSLDRKRYRVDFLLELTVPDIHSIVPDVDMDLLPHVIFPRLNKGLERLIKEANTLMNLDVVFQKLHQVRENKMKDAYIELLNKLYFG